MKISHTIFGSWLALLLWPILMWSLLTGSTSPAAAAGFDGLYQFRIGDYDGDALKDIVVLRPESFAVLSVGSIRAPLPIRGDVASFVLLQRPLAEGGMVLHALDPGRDLTGWQVADLDPRWADVDFDKHSDLHLRNVGTYLPGLPDQLVFADSRPNQPPVHVTGRTEAVDQFFREAQAWLLDQNYFDDNALPVVSATPSGQATWQGFVSDATDFLAISQLLSICELTVGSQVCVISAAPPLGNCYRYVQLYDDFGRPIGIRLTDICQYPLHAYSYPPGTVTIESDYSIFSPDAMALAEAIQLVAGDLPDLSERGHDGEVQTMNTRLAEILERVLGRFEDDPVADQEIDLLVSCHALPALRDNNTDHPDYPGDDEFDRSDRTFHHYDTRTRLCRTGEHGCTTAVADIVLRTFSYPAERLQPQSFLQFDGRTPRAVYVAFAFWARQDPEAYTTFFGDITQIQGALTGQPLPPNTLAIRNRTLANHTVFPGTITRSIEQDQEGLSIFTHGIGVNIAQDLNTPVGRIPVWTLPIPSRAVHFILGCGNDHFGPDAFKTLDKVAVRWWRNTYGQPLALRHAATPLFGVPSD